MSEATFTSKPADADKQAEALRAAELKEVMDMVEWLFKQGRLYQMQHGLSTSQVALCVALMQVNCRQTYPEGKDVFDKIHEYAWELVRGPTDN